MRKALIVAGLSLLLLLPGCRPEGIIPPEEMTALFAAFYQADASVEVVQENSPGDYLHFDSIRVYRPILEEHGYTEEIFRESLNYYLHHPDKMIKIYDRACDLLDKEANNEFADLDEEDDDTVLHEAASADSTMVPDSSTVPEKKAPRRQMRKKMTRQELKQLEKDLR